MWQAIEHVTSGFTLCAFIVAVIASVIKARLAHRRELIESAPEEARADLVAKTLEFFDVDTSGLSRKQQYDIAIKQINDRMERFRNTAVVVVILAVTGAVVSVSMFAMALVKPNPSPRTLSDSGPGDTLMQYDPFGELRPGEYDDIDGSQESEYKAKNKVEQRLEKYPDQALVKEADALCQNLYKLARRWSQEQKEAGSDVGKTFASDTANIIAYSHRSWPEVEALRTALVPKIPAKRVEQIDVQYSSGASLVDKTHLDKAEDVESVRQYLKTLTDAFVATRGK